MNPESKHPEEEFGETWIPEELRSVYSEKSSRKNTESPSVENPLLLAEETKRASRRKSIRPELAKSVDETLEMKECRYCKEMMKESATRCPHCGQPARGMGSEIVSGILKAILILLILGIFLFLLGGCILGGCQEGVEEERLLGRDNTEDQYQRQLKDLLGTFATMPEVRWMEFEGNNVYVGFRRFPADTRQLIHAWALQGNLKIDFGVHVWAIEDVEPGWRPGKPGRFMEATARYGKIE